MNISKERLFDKDPKERKTSLWQKFFLLIVVALVTSASFGAGLLIAGNSSKEGVRIEYDPSLSSLHSEKPTANTANASAALKTLETGIVASKNSNKYHYSYCPGAKQIGETNKIFFRDAEDAEASGYTLAGNCKKR